MTCLYFLGAESVPVSLETQGSGRPFSLPYTKDVSDLYLHVTKIHCNVSLLKEMLLYYAALVPLKDIFCIIRVSFERYGLAAKVLTWT
jgi:hypothetical protein